LRDRLNKILAAATGQPVSKIEKDVERDYFMYADEAKKYGLIDEVLKQKK
jgi:ATP-dependent Clp protease protease subunit